MKVIILLLFAILFTNCSNLSKETILENGLNGYRITRDINEQFVKNFEVRKIGFFKTPTGNIQYALLLNDDISSTEVQKYSLGVHAYKPNDNDQFLIWDIKPNLELFGNNRYIISEFRDSNERLDSISFFLYDRDKYRNVIGNRIVLKNISL